MKIIIIGAGEVGFHIASRLAMENKDVVVVDTDPSALKRVSENLDVQVVVGSGSSPSVLIDAGINTAEIMLAVTDSDEANLVACLVADIVSSSTKKLARIRSADFDRYHENFREHAPHIDTIINPEIEVVKTIERLMQVPGAVEVSEFADGKVQFVGRKLNEGCILAGLRLSELKEKIGNPRPLIAAIVRNDKIIVPRGNDSLHAGDLIYFISDKSKVGKTMEIFGQKPEPPRRVMIVGGGRIGTRLALKLEEQSIHTKIIEKNPDRCRELSEMMNKAVVLHGDASDQSLLREENINDMDLVVTLTDDEETNILVSLLAKRMGALNTITKISKFSYFPIMDAIGVEQVVSPRLSAIDSILQHFRKGRVLSAISIHGEQAEVIEAEALATSELVGKELKTIAFPKGALLIGVIRGEEIIIPTGDTIIHHGDRVIIFVKREVIQKIEKFLTVKLEFF